MNCCPTLRRLLAGLVTVAILAPVVAAVVFTRNRDPQPVVAADAKPSGNWPLFGGTVQRNMVNLVEKNARTDGLRDGKNEGVQDEKYKDKTDADILWKLDMIGELGVFPHNLAVCSPLVVGDTLFVITSNGVDEEHIKIPRPDAPSFLAVD